MVELPSTLKRIKEGAFWRCKSLQTIRIPEGNEEIGAGAFADCSNLNQIDLPTSIKIIGKEAFGSINIIGKKAFYGCIHNKSLSKVTFSSCPSELETEPLEGNTFLHSSVAKDYPTAFVAPLVERYPS
eukprot:2393515-Ditylum_brightwellii.AAC.1